MKQYTPRAQKALLLARQEAIQLHHNHIGTEHILLGLIRLGEGVETNVLVKLGLNLENVRAAIEKVSGNTPDEKRPIPYTARTKRVLQAAKDEANALHHTYIGTEHILLGLLLESEGPAAEIFKKFQVDTEQFRKEILKELNP